MKEVLRIGGKTVTVYCEAEEAVPVVYFNTVMQEGEAVRNECKKIGCPPFALAAVSGIHWDHDMSPWAIPPISANDTPCTGGADDYVRLLTEEIVPAVSGLFAAKPTYSALAGYSLAGLFAVYALYKTDVFRKVASASGSFWFPDFNAFAESHPLCPPESLYFSLGNRESRTNNALLNTVENNTKALERFYAEHYGVRTIYEENVGNHFQNANGRMAKGIKWILEN